MVVRDLRDHGQVVRHVDRGRSLLFEITDLNALSTSIWVVTSSAVVGFVQNQQVRLAAQRHGGHQALQLPAGHLVGIALAQAIRIGKLQRPVELLGPDFGLLPAQLPMEDGGLGHLLADGERGIEGGGGALREVGDPLPAKIALLVRIGMVMTSRPCSRTSPPVNSRPGLQYPSAESAMVVLPDPRLADQRHHLPRARR